MLATKKLGVKAEVPAELRAALGTFKVHRKQCGTCIYRSDSPLNLAELENAVRDDRVGFKGHRICHHSEEACCRGFWDRHGDDFPAGQISQRLGLVEFVEHDVLTAAEKSNGE